MKDCMVSVAPLHGSKDLLLVTLPKALPPEIRQALQTDRSACVLTLPPEEPGVLVCNSEQELSDWLCELRKRPPRNPREGNVLRYLLVNTWFRPGLCFDRALGTAAGIHGSAILRLGGDGRLRLFPAPPSGAAENQGPKNRAE